MLPILLLGGGGHCKACIDVIEAEKKFQILGIVDRKERIGSAVLGHEVIGSDDELPALISQIKRCLVSVGQIGVDDTRARLFEVILSYEGECPVVISPRAYVARTAKIGAGTIVMHGAMINADAIVGANCIINSNALIEHDAHVGDHCHLATGSIVNGGAKIGTSSFMGSRSVVLEGRVVGDAVTIGAGEIVRRDVGDGIAIVG